MALVAELCGYGLVNIDPVSEQGTLRLPFLERNHAPDDFEFTVLEQIQPARYNKINLNRLLLQRESFWIYKLGTLVPGGLNNENELNCFLG